MPYIFMVCWTGVYHDRGHSPGKADWAPKTACTHARYRAYGYGFSSIMGTHL